VAKRFTRTGERAPLFLDVPALGAKTVFFVLLAAVLMVLDHRQGYLDNLRHALSVVVYPLQWAVNAPFAMGRWASEALATRHALEASNAALEAERRDLQVQLQKLRALEAENERLRALMGSARKAGEKVLVAELMRVDLDPFRHRVLLDKGSNDEVHDGQPVIDAAGVVGQVAHSGPFSAEVVLITDPSHALPVEVNRNGLRTIAVGTGEIDRLSLPYLPNSADIVEGDLLISSGLGGRFPRGYPVGTVRRVARDPTRAFAEIDAVPAAALNRSREVLLVFGALQLVGPPTPEDLEPPAARQAEVAQ
jgi:rod shape-determining protein MreC